MIILFGLAGSGKGTQGKALSEIFGWRWLSVGEAIRQHGGYEEIINNGGLIPDEDVIRLMDKQIKKAEDEGFEHVEGDVAECAEDGAKDNLGVIGGGGGVTTRGVIADQTGDQSDGALVDEGDHALGAPAGNDVVQAGADARCQKSGAGAKEQAA